MCLQKCKITLRPGLVGFCACTTPNDVLKKAKFNKTRPNFTFFQKSQKEPNFINVLTWYQSDLVQLISNILNLSSKVFNFTKNYTGLC